MSAEVGRSETEQTSNSSFERNSSDLQAAALKATKLAVALPDDINFNRTVDNEFAQAIDSCSAKALRLTNGILNVAGRNYASASRVKGKRKLEDLEDVVDSFGSLVVDVLDQLFERADINLDEYLGRTKPSATPVRPPQVATRISSSRQGRLDPSILYAAYLPKPQLKFRKKVDNSDRSAWTPTSKHKYNAQMPLGYGFHDSVNASDEGQSDGRTLLNFHPYSYEIKHTPYPQHMFEHKEAVAPLSFENTPFTWIGTKEGLASLLDKLRHAQEIAVDLEHHSYRSFSGFLCLMQISTREEDFIVDTLALREELEELNEIFTDPKIVKVFHGAESDVVWLQQDFNIYVVNLFDTYHASKLLDFPKHGLGALLEMYCDYVPDKRYQLADWRIRPLPSDMLAYARADTHFLLYIYDNLRNALLDRVREQTDPIRAVLDQSQETALRVYEREVYDEEYGNGPGGWNALAMKWGRVLSGVPLAVFRAVHAWRDAVARKEDESTRYVLPNHYLFQLAERPPADMTALLGIFRPVPPLVRTQAANLLEVIRSAVREALAKSGSERAENLGSHSAGDDAPISRTEKLHEASVLSEITSAGIKNLLPDLWVRRSASHAAPSSSLLDSKEVTSRPQATGGLSTRSVLFPAGWMSTEKFASLGSKQALTRYRDVVSRIHSTLTVAPVMPHAPTATREITNTTTPTDSASTSAPAADVEQVEIPFVPANQRQSQATSTKVETADTIVVVGRSQERKRKRSRKQAGANETDKGNKMKKARDKEAISDSDNESVGAKAEEFDYASSPNFLDEAVKDKFTLLSGSQKGKTPKGRRAFGYGNFPAPPRAYNEVKGANLSQTFKK